QLRPNARYSRCVLKSGTSNKGRLQFFQAWR
ncbi:MAG: hypothetical protein ACI82I_003421, partial [Gammaproteobacteria bacterium]